MYLSFILSICALSVFVEQSAGYSVPDQSDSPFNELPCIVIGGTCTSLDRDCPPGTQITVQGLCPFQQKKRVQCCHFVPKQTDTCRSHGGECIDSSDRCPENLTYRNAVDCTKDQKCCIFVK